MARPKPIAIEHKELKLVGSCLPEALPAWSANGWTVVDDGSSNEVVEEPTVEPLFSGLISINGPSESEEN